MFFKHFRKNIFNNVYTNLRNLKKICQIFASMTENGQNLRYKKIIFGG
jgi:hypothetical protein